jgi:hypothetical protein
MPASSLYPPRAPQVEAMFGTSISSFTQMPTGKTVLRAAPTEAFTMPQELAGQLKLCVRGADGGSWLVCL